MDWTRPRSGRFRFWRVDAATRLEVEQITTVRPGGSITLNANTALKVSGRLPVAAPIDIGDDLVRIYYEAVDADGDSDSIALATVYAEADVTSYTSAAATSDLTLYSVLLALQDAQIRETLTIVAGSVAVDEAADICEEAGLPVVASASTRELQSDASWDPGTSLLEIVNYLMDVAGFWSVSVDGWGRVVMEPYTDPASRTAVWSFTDGDDSVFLPSVDVSTGAFRVPNVYVLVCSRPDDEPLVGSYTNDDPASPYSTVVRGREITVTDTVDDAVDTDDLDARAKMRLLAATADNETTTIRHAYAPLTIRDVCAFRWSAHDLSLRGAVQSQEIALVPSAMTTTTVKRVGA